MTRCGLPPVRMSVNLSAVQIRRPELTDVVAEALAAWEIDPASLELEITEGVLMDDTGWTRRTLERLRALGLSLSLDDFGTGFSSLGYLKRYPVDRIKIDRSFVADIGKSSQDDALVRVMIALAHTSDLGYAKREYVKREYQKGICQKGICQKGIRNKGICQKGICQKGDMSKGDT